MSNSNGRSPQAQIVVDAIDRLPPTERAVLDLSVRHEMDDGEIAAIVGLDPREVTRLRLGVLERMTSEFASLGLGRWGALGAALHEVGAEARSGTVQEALPEEAPPEEEASPEEVDGLPKEAEATPVEDVEDAAAAPVDPPPEAPAPVPTPASSAPPPPPILSSQLGPARRTRPKVLVAAGAIPIALVVVAASSGRLDRGHDRPLPQVTARRGRALPPGGVGPPRDTNPPRNLAAERA